MNNWYKTASASRFHTAAIPSEKLSRTTLYHSTANTEAGLLILKDGVIKTRDATGETSGRGFLSPVYGMIYSSPSLEYAAIYALGGVLMGHKSDWQNRTSPRVDGRYGYVFQIDPASLSDVQPDEDSVGEILSKGMEIERRPGQEPRILDNGEAPWWLTILARKIVAPTRLMKLIEGEYIYFASVGKQLLSRMTDAQKLYLIDEYGTHVANRGSLKIAKAWRIDKERSKEVAKDGSNLLSIAEEIPIGKV